MVNHETFNPSSIEENSELSKLESNRRQALASLKKVSLNPKETFLREHQISMVQSLIEHLEKGETAGYMSEPTGSGKSAVIAKIAEVMGLKTIILSPTQQILRQTRDDAKKFTPDLNLTNYYANEKDSSGKVINTTYQSIPTVIENENFNSEEIQLVICDELHTSLGEQRHTIFRNFPNALKIGMTATPAFDQLEEYMERGIVDEDEEWTKLYTNLIHEMSIEEAMERGILINPLNVHLLKTNVTVSDIQVQSNGEYREADVRRYFATKSRNALAIGMIAGVDKIPAQYNIPEDQKRELEAIHTKISGKKTVVFGIDIDHAEQLAQDLRDAEVNATAVHGKTKNSEDILRDHSKGNTQVVTGVDMLGIGWNSPETEVGIFLRPTYSEKKAVQQLGRIMRISPDSGKENAFAIQLVDQFSRRVDRPVLIPDIFDPEFVMKGNISKSSTTPGQKENAQDKAVVSFSGMDIESIVEEIQIKSMLKSRFSQGSIQEISNLTNKLIQETHEQYPDATLYELFRLVVDQLPQRIPSEAQEKSFQAIADPDPKIKELGKNSFLLFNMKTILRVVDLYFDEDSDTIDDRDELFSTATAAVLEKLSNISGKTQVSQQVHSIARNGLVNFLSKNENMPPAWIRRGNQTKKTINDRIDETLGPQNYIMSEKEIGDLAGSIIDETSVGRTNLEKYIIFKNSLRIEKQANNEDATFKEYSSSALEEDLKRAMETLTDRERRVLESRFGTEEGKSQTLEDVARQFGVTRERITQIEKKALRKLRHPTRSKHIIDHMDDDYIARPIKTIKSESSANKAPYRDPDLISELVKKQSQEQRL